MTIFEYLNLCAMICFIRAMPSGAAMLTGWILLAASIAGQIYTYVSSR